MYVDLNMCAVLQALIAFSRCSLCIVCNSCHCSDSPVIPGVRLAGGDDQYEGRVEVFLRDEWGTICDDNWDESDAAVVCRQLGFSGVDQVYSNSERFGAGTGRIWFDNLDCIGTETHLLQCPTVNALGNNNCHHAEDAGLRCRRGRRYLFCRCSVPLCTHIFKTACVV